MTDAPRSPRTERAAADRGDAMRYVCLVYSREQPLVALSQEELDALSGERAAHTDALLERGLCVAAGLLEPVHAATTVRIRDERVSVTDGPAIESREQLGGFYVIEARDLNDAIRLASGIPAARLGAIEVRPVRTAVGDAPVDGAERTRNR